MSTYFLYGAGPKNDSLKSIIYYQRAFNVYATSHRRCIDVDATLYKSLDSKWHCLTRQYDHLLLKTREDMKPSKSEGVGVWELHSQS